MKKLKKGAANAPQILYTSLAAAGVVVAVGLAGTGDTAQVGKSKTLPPAQPSQAGQLAQRQKVGDTIRPWRMKWGYDSPTKSPKAQLFWVTDSTIASTDWTSLGLTGSGTSTLTAQPGPTGGSGAPIGEVSHKENPGYGILANSNAGSPIGYQMLNETLDPSQGAIVEIEAQVDVAEVNGPMNFALAVHQNGTTWIGPATTASPKGYERIILKSPLQNAVRIAGNGANPVLGSQPFSFGIVATPAQSNGPAKMRLDNFEVRVAMKCSPADMAAEASRKAKKRQELNTLRSRMSQVQIKGPNSVSGDVIRKEMQDYEAGNKQPPLNNSQIKAKDCCIDTQLSVDAQGNIIIPPGEIPTGEDVEYSVTANYVDEEQPVGDVFEGMDTRTTDWLGSLPCEPAVGEFLPDSAKNIDALADDPLLEELTGDKNADNFKNAMGTNWAEEDDEYKDLVTDSLGPVPSWAFGAGFEPPPVPKGNVTFNGRDIVYVHGLKLQHIYDGLLMDRTFAGGTKGGPPARWKSIPGADSDTLYQANKPFFPSTNTGLLYDGRESAANYFGDLAFKNWIGDRSIDVNTKVGNSFLLDLLKRSELRSLSQPGYLSDPTFTVDGHVGQFLLGNGYHNRFMIASYSCMDRLDAAVRSVLTQTAMAMADGIGVYNPSVPNGLKPLWKRDPVGMNQKQVQRFGSTGLVFITQSTGALVVDVAMSRANSTPQWNVKFIPDFTRAHVSAQGAAGGSHIASLANMLRSLPALSALKLGSTQAGFMEGLDMILFKAASNQFYGGKDPFAPPQSRSALMNAMTSADLARYGQAFPSTIIQDLRPEVVYKRHRAHIDNTPVQTLVMNGGHPDSIPVVKHLLHPGFDDNTVNTSATVASRAHPDFWPFGSYTGSVNKNFDLGLFGPGLTINLPKVKILTFTLTAKLGTTYASQMRRALGYWMDQRWEHKYMDSYLTPGLKLLGPGQAGFIAAGGSPYLSPSGMIQSDIATLPLTPFNPLWRAKNHFGFLNVAGDHFEPTHDQGVSGIYKSPMPSNDMASDIHYPHYMETDSILGLEQNDEESFVPNSTKVYQPYDPPGVIANSALLKANPTTANVVGDSLLNAVNVGPFVGTKGFNQNYKKRGCYFEVSWNFKKLKKKGSRRWCWWYRSYMLLGGWQGNMQFDYVYGKTMTVPVAGKLGGILRD